IWLADPRRARWHLHFTPTSSSWLNLVERWFGELTERRLKRGVFTSVPHLIEAIELWAEHWNDNPKPFVWHKPAQEIIAKVRRGRSSLSRVISASSRFRPFSTGDHPYNSAHVRHIRACGLAQGERLTQRCPSRR